ncbi:hypothetical protein Pmar_PMAR027070, partial [Perkinsus marinus ATCC 50983]
LIFMLQDELDFVDPTTFMLGDNLCTFHFLTRKERAMHKGTSEGFDPLSDAEKGSSPDGTNLKPRYPAVDYLRGITILFVVTFHLIWVLADFEIIPDFPDVAGYNLPITNYLYFLAFYSVSFFWGNLSRLIHPCIQYLL